jgi:hypothetical protein
MLVHLLSSPETFPFVVALGLMFVIGMLEGLSTLMGMGLSGFLDGMIPEFDVDADFDADVDGDGHIPDAGVFSKVLGWMHVGRVPILILFVVFLTFFGLGGLFVQAVSRGLLGGPLPTLVAMIPAIFTALVSVRATGGLLGKLMPNDETDAVSSHSFIGRVATLGAATATEGNPAQAKLKDQHGQTHYLLVEPDVSGAVLESGSEVVLVRQAGARFFAINNTNVALSSVARERAL